MVGKVVGDVKLSMLLDGEGGRAAFEVVKV